MPDYLKHHHQLGGGFNRLLQISPPNLGANDPILQYFIFFKWIGSTTHLDLVNSIYLDLHPSPKKNTWLILTGDSIFISHTLGWSRLRCLLSFSGHFFNIPKEVKKELLGTRFFPVTLLGILSDLFQGWKRDLHLGYQKVTWKKLVGIFCKCV